MNRRSFTAWWPLASRGRRINQNRSSTLIFLILTDDEIVDGLEGSWSGSSYDSSDPKSLNEVLRHSEGMTPGTQFESGFLNLKNIHNIYKSSPNIGSFSILGPRGECNIISKSLYHLITVFLL
jgi:hypothetical protein